MHKIVTDDRIKQVAEQVYWAVSNHGLSSVVRGNAVSILKEFVEEVKTTTH